MGEDEQPLTLVGCTDFRRREEARRKAVAHVDQSSGDFGKAEAEMMGDVLKEDEWRLDLADDAGVHIPRSCCAGTCAVCEVKITRGGRERTVRACTATPRDEDVVDVSSGDAELARMMARFEGQDGLDYGRVAPAAPSRPARPPPPPVYEDAWREPEPVVFADDDDDFSLGGGAAPWDVIQ